MSADFVVHSDGTVDSPQVTSGTEKERAGAKPQVRRCFAWSRQGFDSPRLHGSLRGAVARRRWAVAATARGARAALSAGRC